MTDTLFRITTGPQQAHIISASGCALVAIAEARQLVGDDYVTHRATRSLAEQVMAEGGQIAWGQLDDGTACTLEEADDDA